MSRARDAGQIVKELIENDRIIGGISATCSESAKRFYSLFVKGKYITADARLAEMTKLTENAYRDVNIAFANELSMICDELDLDVWELIKLANHHPRVNILQPGPGVGGHCIAVDPWFIVNAAPKKAQLIRTAREVNDNKSDFVFEKIKQAATQCSHPRIACLGLTYKPNSDDLRESPAVKIVHKLATTCKEAMVHIVEPNIQTLPALLRDFKACQLVSLKEALSTADIVIFMVAHREFNMITERELIAKVVINAASQDTNRVPLLPIDANQNRPVSAYGRMMMMRIYGCLIP